MTRIADVPAREPVSQNPRAAARPGLELQPETLRSRAALLYGQIYDSLTARPEVKEPNCLPYRLDTAHPTRGARCSTPSGSRTHRPVPGRFRTSRARWGVLKCTDLGCFQPNLEGHQRMADQRRKRATTFASNRRQRRAVQQREHATPPRLPGGSPGANGAWETIIPSRRRSATGRRPDHGSGTTLPPGCAPNTLLFSRQRGQDR